jgi:hypothetical protein
LYRSLLVLAFLLKRRDIRALQSIQLRIFDKGIPKRVRSLSIWSGDHAHLNNRPGLGSGLRAMVSGVMTHSTRKVISRSATFIHGPSQIVSGLSERPPTLFPGSSSIVKPPGYFVILEHLDRIGLTGKKCAFLIPPILPPP